MLTLLASGSGTSQHPPVKLYTAFASVAAGLSAGLSASAWAACSSPAANAGEQSFDSNQNVMVYCDGTNWVSMAGGVSVTIGGTTNNATAGGAGTQVQYNDGSS